MITLGEAVYSNLMLKEGTHKVDKNFKAYQPKWNTALINQVALQLNQFMFELYIMGRDATCSAMLYDNFM